MVFDSETLKIVFLILVYTVNILSTNAQLDLSEMTWVGSGTNDGHTFDLL